MSQLRLLVFAPTRRAASEHSFEPIWKAFPFGWMLTSVTKFLWGVLEMCLWSGSLSQQSLSRLRWFRLAGWPASLVAKELIQRHQPDLMLVEFGFHAVRVMEAAELQVCQWWFISVVLICRLGASSVQKQRYRRLVQILSGAIVKSEPMRRTLMGLGLNEERILISAWGQ